MKNRSLIIFISMLVILSCLSAGAWAKLALSRTEKAQLKYKHSVIKKRGTVTKKSTLKSLQAKQKDQKKRAKKIRVEAGI